MEIETMKVKPWSEDQGGHVVINADDFDPQLHALLDAEKPGGADANGDGKVTAAELKAALDAKGVSYRGNASKAELHALLDAANTPT